VIKKGLQSLSERLDAVQTAANGTNFTASCKEYLSKYRFQRAKKMGRDFCEENEKVI